MPDLSDQFQRAALAVLLCTNSKLGRKWRENPKDVSPVDLVDLGFSEEFATQRLALISGVGGDKLLRFRDVATVLQNIIWDGEPPHPPEEVAKEIVVASRVKDRERDAP